MSFLRKLTALGPNAPSVSTAIRNLGPLSYTRYRLARRRNHFLAPNATFPLTTPYARHPLICRAHTSDLDVFTQIFVEREYAPLDTLPRRAHGFIIDAGANVGYSSAYLLTRFPNATLIALEPAPDNYAILVQNLAPYGPRAICLQAALWSHETTLTIDVPSARDGHEWSRQVTPCNAEPRPAASKQDTSNLEFPVPAKTIATLLNDTSRPRITLLKIDIEGAESEVFSPSADTTWLARVDNLVIELHNKPPFPEARPIVERALAPHPFARSTSGELTIYRRP